MPSSITKVNEPFSGMGTATAATGAKGSQASDLTARWLLPLILVGIVVGACTWFLTLQSFGEQSRVALQNNVEARCEAVRIWFQTCVRDANRASSHPSVKDALRNGSSPEVDPSLLSSEMEYIGWAILDSGKQVVDCSVPELKSHSLGFPELQDPQVKAQQVRLCNPFASPIPLTETGPLSRENGPLLIVRRPMFDGLQQLGSFVLLIDPSAKFSELLGGRSRSVYRTYATDRNGNRTSFLLGDGACKLNKSVNPNPTVAQDQLARGATGFNINGYSDQRGERVVGAWRWMPDVGVGICSEMEHSLAFAGMSTLRNCLLAFLALAVLPTWFLWKQAKSQPIKNQKPQLHRRMGQYNLGEEVGRGGMGAVYRGRHQLLKRDVAIKVLEHAQATEKAMSRFEREVQMTAKLRHPNTVEIYDYGRTDEGTFFYVMEFIDGISMQELVDDYGRQPAERVIFLLLQICGSISEAHRFGMTHRDIKPANIMVTAQAGLFDLVKVLDFGLVKEMDHETMELTRTDSVTGTPMYMSPEAVRDASKVDQRSDIYSIGAVGYTLLTGVATFDGESTADICAKQLNELPIRPAERIGQSLAEDLQNILMCCLQKSPEQRPISIDDLADALVQCVDSGRWSQADACQWWQQIYDGPRDETPGAADNLAVSHAPAVLPDQQADLPNASKGSDTKVDHELDPTDEAS